MVRASRFFSLFFSLGVVHAVHVLDELAHHVGVAPLVVVPCDELEEVLIEGDTGIDVEDAGGVGADEVAGDHFVMGNGDDALHVGLGSAGNDVHDLLIGGVALELQRQVNEGHVGGGNAEAGTGDLAGQIGNDLADGLGGAGGGGDDVVVNAAAGAPVSAAAVVNGLLLGGGGVDGGRGSGYGRAL